jgi:hypothetical protein
MSLKNVTEAKAPASEDNQTLKCDPDEKNQHVQVSACIDKDNIIRCETL